MPDRLETGALDGAERVEFERLQVAIRVACDAVYEWLLSTDALVWSRDAREMLGLPADADISDRARFEEFVHPDDRPTFRRVRNGGIASFSPFQIEYRIGSPDGEARWVQERGAVQRGADGRPERVVGAIHLVSQRKQREAQLEWLASYDELTGHYNRARLRDALDQAIEHAAKHEVPGAYLSVSINDLAVFSDAYGHVTADAAVIAVGNALERCLRASDIIGYIAPGHFGVIVSACPEDQIEKAAERILSAIQRTKVDGTSGPLQLTASVGAVSFPSTAGEPNEVMVKAEVAREQAHRGAHSGLVVYNIGESHQLARLRTLDLAKQIQLALRDDGFRLAFQPVVKGNSQEVMFYECLLRMRQPDGDYMVAGKFLEVAEDIGLVRQIDRRVIELAMEELYDDPDITLAVNVSGLTTADPVWLSSLAALAKRRSDVAERLIVEITETAALADIEETVWFVRAVRSLGCRVALDDFGAGYTSFRHLKSLEVDIVKIDGSFVTNLDAHPRDFLFVKTLQDLAHGFGLETVAECVETESVAELLGRQGVHYLQGYHFGRPSFERPWRDEKGSTVAVG